MHLNGPSICRQRSSADWTIVRAVPRRDRMGGRERLAARRDDCRRGGIGVVRRSLEGVKAAARVDHDNFCLRRRDPARDAIAATAPRAGDDHDLVCEFFCHLKPY